MKKYTFLPAMALIAIFMSNCVKDTRIITYTANVPVYMPYDQVQVISSESPRTISDPGKIYLWDNYIFVNEINKGIHVIDNSNPSSPVFVSFMNIPGNIDISVKDNILYADNFLDLVAVDISTISSPVVVKRIDKQFPYSIPEYDTDYPISELDSEKGMVSSWEVKEVTKKCEDKNDCLVNTQGIELDRSFDVMNFNSTGNASNSGQTKTVKRNVGIGGSLGRFTIYNNNLYVASKSSLLVYDISNSADPVYLSSVIVETGGDNIESLFTYDEKLFIGSPVGVYIYSLTNPSSPSYISQFSHVRRCDPVVVSGNYAYSTQRGDAGCGGWVSELSVIDISYISSPYLSKSYSMDDPYGLGLDNGMLFVCDGKSGLKVYDITNTPTLSLKYHYSSLNAFDVIPDNNLLILIGSTGVYQYDYSDPENLVQLSYIPMQ